MLRLRRDLRFALVTASLSVTIHLTVISNSFNSDIEEEIPIDFHPEVN